MPQDPTAIGATPSVAEAGDRPAQMLHQLIRRGRSLSGNERNCCFLNTGGLRFADISALSGLDFPDDGRGVARVDWDADGDLDLWINNRNGPQVRFLKNDVPTTNHFLAVHLVGRTCNRDAIGARVELRLKGESASLLKTLHAGDAFLAQSSKWVHFGLGRSSDIEQLVVHWPSGPREEFGRPEADRRYRLVQGSGRAEEWRGPTRDVNLRASTAKIPETTAALRLFSASRVPLPRLDYTPFDGSRKLLSVRGGRPLLLNLWASWCAPCVKELGELSREEPRLRAAGLDIIALAVDGLEGGAADPQTAQELLKRLSFPFASGMATVGLLEKLQIVNNKLFDRHRRLPLPTSILIDRRFRLAAIYKGPLEIDRVLADVRQLSLEGEALRRASLPFEGRWFSDPREFRLMPLAWDLLVEGFLEDGLEYASRNKSRLKSDPEYATLLARMGYELLERGQAEAAAEQYRAALEVEPRFTVARLNLAAALLEQGQAKGALAEYRQALRHSPSDVRVHSALARLLATSPDGKIRDGAEAVHWGEKAAEATGHGEPGVLDALAAAYAEAGRFDDAIATARKAIKLASSQGHEELAAELQERLLLYENGRPYRAE